MKLFMCTRCNDVVSLIRSANRACFCGASSGRYTDQLNAEISGPCVPIGFANRSLLTALLAQPESGDGAEFVAFVIPKLCSTITYKT